VRGRPSAFKGFTRLAAFMGGLVGLGAAWWMCSLLVPAGFIPAPLPVLARFFQLLPGPLAVHAAASLGRVAAALVLALLSAVPAGMAIGRSRTADLVFAPVIYVLYPVPKIALLPVLMLLFGLGDPSKVLIVFLVLFFQVLVAVRDASREVPPQFLLSLRSLGGTRRQAARYVLLPSLVPALLSSLRIGIGTALAVLFFSETFGTRAGLGWFVMESWMRLSYVDMFAGIFCLGLLGLVLFLCVDAAHRRLCRWQAGSVAAATAAG
jgi:NitT/TauT family transport system permease protein